MILSQWIWDYLWDTLGTHCWHTAFSRVRLICHVNWRATLQDRPVSGAKILKLIGEKNLPNFCTDEPWLFQWKWGQANIWSTVYWSSLTIAQCKVLMFNKRDFYQTCWEFLPAFLCLWPQHLGRSHFSLFKPLHTVVFSLNCPGEPLFTLIPNHIIHMATIFFNRLYWFQLGTPRKQKWCRDEEHNHSQVPGHKRKRDNMSDRHKTPIALLLWSPHDGYKDIALGSGLNCHYISVSSCASLYMSSLMSPRKSLCQEVAQVS